MTDIEDSQHLEELPLIATTKKNPKKLNAKHIKHNPPSLKRTAEETSSVFLVKSNTPFISAVKRITKMIHKIESNKSQKLNHVMIKGMGKSVEKVLSLGLHFQDELRYKINTYTGSVEVLDEFKLNKEKGVSNLLEADDEDDDDDDDDNTLYKKRMVSFVQVKIILRK